MSNRTPIYIVCSPRPRTGKTFVARLTTDFLRLDDKPVNAFDVNAHEPVLTEFIPRLTQTIEIASTQDQMAMFDRLVRDDAVPKVVDLGSASFERFFKVAEEICFIEEARARAIEPVILFPADPHPNSGKAYADLQKRFDGITLIPVHNDAIVKGHLYRDRFPTLNSVAVPLQIPVLNPGLKVWADKPEHSFAEYYETLPMDVPLGISFELRDWTKRTFREFREMELRLLLRKLRSSLKQVVG